MDKGTSIYPELSPSAPPINDYKNNDQPPPYHPGPHHHQMPQQQTQQPTAIIINQQVSQPFGPYPTVVNCPFCNHEVTTKVEPKVGTLTYLLSLGLALVCGCCVCCLIPCCVDRCKDVEHHCTNCGKPLGLYKRL